MSMKLGEFIRETVAAWRLFEATEGDGRCAGHLAVRAIVSEAERLAAFALESEK